MNADIHWSEYRVRAQGRLEYPGWTRHHSIFGMGAENGQTRFQSYNQNYLITDTLISLGSMQDVLHESGMDRLSLSHNLFFVYGQDEWDFYPDWTLTWGVRLEPVFTVCGF